MPACISVCACWCACVCECELKLERAGVFSQPHIECKGACLATGYIQLSDSSTSVERYFAGSLSYIHSRSSTLPHASTDSRYLLRVGSDNHLWTSNTKLDIFSYEKHRRSTPETVSIKGRTSDNCCLRQGVSMVHPYLRNHHTHTHNLHAAASAMPARSCSGVSCHSQRQQQQPGNNTNTSTNTSNTSNNTNNNRPPRSITSMRRRSCEDTQMLPNPNTTFLFTHTLSLSYTHHHTRTHTHTHTHTRCPSQSWLGDDFWSD